MKLMIVLLLSLSANVFADVTVPMNLVDANGVGANVGEVTISETEYGLVFSPSLHNLTPGMHGFHLHQNASCEQKEVNGKIVAGKAAGGHYDPVDTKKHDTPWGEGHRGDLPALYVAMDGSASRAVLAPRVALSDLSGRALMIHAGGDNHADIPAKLGGGGARISCGVIK